MVDIPDDEEEIQVPVRKGTGDLHRDFLTGLARDFQEHGEAVVRRLRRSDPGKYLDLIAKVVPKEMLVRNVNVMGDRELVEMCRELLGDAAASEVAMKLGLDSGILIDVTVEDNDLDGDNE